MTGEPIRAVRADEVYRLRDFGKIVGLREWALRAARNQGLRVIRAHGHSYVRGIDWLTYLESVGHRQTRPASAE